GSGELHRPAVNDCQQPTMDGKAPRSSTRGNKKGHCSIANLLKVNKIMPNQTTSRQIKPNPASYRFRSRSNLPVSTPISSWEKSGLLLPQFLPFSQPRADFGFVTVVGRLVEAARLDAVALRRDGTG